MWNKLSIIENPISESKIFNQARNKYKNGLFSSRAAKQFNCINLTDCDSGKVISGASLAFEKQ